MLRALAAAIRANVPVLVWGQPGVGKTAYLETFGTRNAFQVETVVGSIREASDFLGLPIEVDGQVRYAPPSWAERLAKASKGLLFLDELTTAAPSVQRAMLRILQEREVGEMTLPPTVALVAAANPPAVAVDGWDLAAPVANRLMHLDWHFDADAWLDGVVTDFAYIDPPSLEAMLGVRTDVDAIRVKGAVTAFLKARPDLQLTLPSDPALAGKGWPSPRSWTNAMAVLAELDPSRRGRRAAGTQGLRGRGCRGRIPGLAGRQRPVRPRGGAGRPENRGLDGPPRPRSSPLWRR